jgi:hypothetical protein
MASVIAVTRRNAAGQPNIVRPPVWRAWQPTASAATAADRTAALPVDVRFDLITQAAAGGTIELPLTRRLTVRANVEWSQADARQTLVAGRLLDGREGEASLTLVGDALVGRVVVDGRLFMVRRAADSSVHLVTEIDQNSLPPEAPPIEPPLPRSAARATPFDETGQHDTNQYVDVMILYTPAARSQAGGTSQIVAELTGAVNNANLSLANAGVTHRFRLAHYEEIAYTETNNMDTDLSRLQAVSDGFLDNVHALRDTYHADTVTLMTTDVDACGLGYLMGPSSVNSSFAPYAFNVVLWSCANANLTFAHETGHNMGLHHDRANASGSPAFSYAYGYAVPGIARDVMAYACTTSTCPRRAIFSTPLYNFPSTNTAAGTATEDNARALNNTSLAVANFRQSGTTQPSPKPTNGDFELDGKADLVVFRPSTGGWWMLRSSTAFATYATYSWGVPNDIPVPADYDGDGKMDLAIYRPSTAEWWILWSSTGYATYAKYGWGVGGDIPVPADYDGDGKADIAVYRPSTAGWWILKSSTNYATYSTYSWGVGGDIPVPGDYDGDGKADIATYRPSTAGWWILKSSSNYATYSTYGWGVGGDVPVPADYDGDGKLDIAVFRPSTAGWWILKSSANYGAYSTYGWGVGGDIAVPADFDGDGKTDIAVYRPSTAGWWILYSSTGYATYSTYSWGLGGDIPTLRRP